MKESMFSFRFPADLRAMIENLSDNPKYLDGKGAFVLSWAVIDMIRVGLASSNGQVISLGQVKEVSVTSLTKADAGDSIKIELNINLPKKLA